MTTKRGATSRLWFQTWEGVEEKDLSSDKEEADIKVETLVCEAKRLQQRASQLPICAQASGTLLKKRVPNMGG